MRAGGSCTLQQALTAEAAVLVKQAVTLAKRRGHGQVTPLHVAATMLTASTGLLRSACLRSHSHPLQCKALELCFNVALNRLPAAASSPVFGIHGLSNSSIPHQVPSISNALIAAFKRAQAHQRRGSIESNQSLLAVKIELDQLVISILDDPSVSRVMREAGFSSSQVKRNVERVVLSSEMSSSSTPSPVHNTADMNSRDMNQNNMLPSNQNGPKQDHPDLLSRVRDEDVMHVIENMMEKRKRSIVIVGECSGTVEGVVRGLTDKLRNGSLSGDVARTFRDVQFVDLSLPSFEHLSREGVERKLGELTAHLRSNHIHTKMGTDNSGGAILFLGDLRWVVENRANAGIEQLAAELGKLICGFGEDKGVWVMGIATLQTYMRCKSGYPSLESIWRLHPVAVPVGSLSFGLISDSNVESSCSSIKKCERGSLSSSWLLPLGVGSHQPDEDRSFCNDCSLELEKEARSLRSSSVNGKPSNYSSSSLPPWLQLYKDEKNRSSAHIVDDGRDYARDLRTEWKLICNSIHRQSQSSETALVLSSPSPSPSPSGFLYELSNPNMNLAKRTRAEYHAWTADQLETLNFNPSPSCRNSPLNSGSSSDDIMEIEYSERFKELREKDMRLLIQKLEEKVPWQKHVIPEIAMTILRCRSGMIKRKRNVKEDENEVKNETWFLFEGTDMDGKEKTARELASLIFGSYNSLVSISIGSQTGHEKICSGIKELAEAASQNPHRVFLIEEVAKANHYAREHLKEAIEVGKLAKSFGEEVGLEDAIIILCSRSLTSRSTPEDEEKETNPSLSLDLNISIAHETGRHQYPKTEDFTGYDVDKRILFEIQEL